MGRPADRHAFPDDTAPKRLVRDRDSIHVETFQKRIKRMGIDQVVTAYRCPWQNPYVERAIGSIRRERFDHLIVLGERHCKRILKDYVGYYNRSWPHLSLDKNSSSPRETSPPQEGKVVTIPQVGGLHHHYERAA